MLLKDNLCTVNCKTSFANSTLVHLNIHNNCYDVNNMHMGYLSVMKGYLGYIFRSRPNVFLDLDLLNDIYELEKLLSHLLLHTLFMISKVLGLLCRITQVGICLSRSWNKDFCLCML